MTVHRAVQDQSANGCAFRVGDLVECVDAAYRPEDGVLPPHVPLVERALYTIERLGPGWDYDGREYACCAVAEAPIANGWLWEQDRFRLIHRPDPKLIEALKALPAKPDLVSA